MSCVGAVYVHTIHNNILTLYANFKTFLNVSVYGYSWLIFAKSCVFKLILYTIE